MYNKTIFVKYERKLYNVHFEKKKLNKAKKARIYISLVVHPVGLARGSSHVVWHGRASLIRSDPIRTCIWLVRRSQQVKVPFA
jgi:hypothetical protein